MGIAIEISGLQVDRGGQVVLPNLSLGVRAGTVTGLLGPSGSGKSTLIRAVVGVQRIKAGTVTVLGLPAGSPPLRSRVGYVTQAPSIYRDLTVEQNLAYFARITDTSAPRVAQVIEVVGLESERSRLVGRLSGGEQTRVSLATALLSEPELLVLDEPTVGLDPVLRRDLWSFFHTLAAGGTTLLVSSHVMDEAERCDALVLLREGRIIADESPADLRARTGDVSLDDAFLHLVEGAQ